MELYKSILVAIDEKNGSLSDIGGELARNRLDQLALACRGLSNPLLNEFDREILPLYKKCRDRLGLTLVKEK